MRIPCRSDLRGTVPFRLGGVRSLVAIAVAAPWVVWALVRTLGLEVPYPFVALLAFTPYAALSSPLPVVVGLLLRRWAIAAVAGSPSLAFAVALVPRARRPGRSRRPRAAADRDDLEPVPRAWRRAGAAADRARARRRRAQRAGAAAAADAPAGPGRARSSSSRAGSSTRGGARRAPACSRARRSGSPPRRQTARGTRSRRSSSTVQGAPPVRIKAVHPAPPVNPTAAPLWRGSLAALPGSDSRGDVQILAGDFNATLDHPELRDLLDRGYTDAADAVGQGLIVDVAGAAPPRAAADDRPRARRPPGARGARHGRADPGSDHRAVIAVLRLPRK